MALQSPRVQLFNRAFKLDEHHAATRHLQKAYDLIATALLKLGWDDLLSCRSQVFVMEEDDSSIRVKSNSTLNRTIGESSNETIAEPVLVREVCGLSLGSISDAGLLKQNAVKFPQAARFKAKEDPAAKLSLPAKRLCERWLDDLFIEIYQVRCGLESCFFGRVSNGSLGLEGISQLVCPGEPGARAGITYRGAVGDVRRCII